MSSTIAALRQPSQRRSIRPLGDYAASDDARSHQILGLHLPDGGVLVIDCLGDSLADARLVARLAPEEPPENASRICEMYLADATRGRCRRVTRQDLSPTPHPQAVSQNGHSLLHDAPLIDRAGRVYRIRAVAEKRSLAALRWTVRSSGGTRAHVLTVRDVVARLESYEPARALTMSGVAVHAENRALSTCCLAQELERLSRSPIVLNRGLREAVQHAVARGAVTRSEIAMRCGRTKRDRRGGLSGETSWLGRRIGELAEGGEAEPTPWIHTDTLALIARDGLGLSPHEVEL